MAVPGYRIFVLNPAMEADNIIDEATALFPHNDQAVSAVDDQYLESFDWRMFADGRVIRRNGDRYSLAPLFNFAHSQETSGPEEGKVFWWDFQGGDIRDTLKSILGVRALSPLLRVVGRRLSLNLRNRDQKIVVKVTLDSGEVVDDEVRTEIPKVFQITEVRGYRKTYLRTVKLFKGLGLEELPGNGSYLSVVLGVIGRQPGDYSSKFSVTLEPEQTLSRAINIIGLNLHRTMERNLPGVLDDIDTEFLHDFRVALRRTRSALSQLKKDIPPGHRVYFAKEFKWLGGVTGPVRDIDVCLKKKEGFKTLVSEDLHEGIERLFRQIHQRRKREFAKVQKSLRSARFVDMMVNWHDFLVNFPEDGSAGSKACGKVANKTIGKCYRNLVHSASQVLDGEDGRDALMHKLRIQGKKFRYLVEFFRSLFPEDSIGTLLKEMKGLQDDLGDFNDLSVQTNSLNKYLTDTSQDPLVVESVKELTRGLEAKKKQLRRRCVSRCRRFMDRNMKDLFGESLKKKAG